MYAILLTYGCCRSRFTTVAEVQGCDSRGAGADLSGTGNALRGRPRLLRFGSTKERCCVSPSGPVADSASCWPPCCRAAFEPRSIRRSADQARRGLLRAASAQSPGTPPPAASGGSRLAIAGAGAAGPDLSRPAGSVLARRREPAQRSANGVQLNFDQAEIRDVVRVILGDTLKRSYTVDSDVQGQVTMSTSAPMAEGDLLAVLETVLRANGATLVESSPGAYRIMPVDAAIGRSEVLPLGGKPVQVRPGYGITIVPLRNISSTSAAQFIQPLVASPEDIRIDPGRNAILFSGTGVRAAERRPDPRGPRRRLDGRQVDRPVPAAARQCRGDPTGVAGDLRAVRSDGCRALDDPLRGPGADERGAWRSAPTPSRCARSSNG